MNSKKRSFVKFCCKLTMTNVKQSLNEPVQVHLSSLLFFSPLSGRQNLQLRITHSSLCHSPISCIKFLVAFIIPLLLLLAKKLSYATELCSCHHFALFTKLLSISRPPQKFMLQVSFVYLFRCFAAFRQRHQLNCELQHQHQHHHYQRVASKRVSLNCNFCIFKFLLQEKKGSFCYSLLLFWSLPLPLPLPLPLSLPLPLPLPLAVAAAKLIFKSFKASFPSRTLVMANNNMQWGEQSKTWQKLGTQTFS